MIHIKAGVSGRYKVQLAKADAEGREIPGTRRDAAPWQDNLITNSGMDFIGGAGANPYWFLASLSVGSGAAAPANTDAALQARVATTSTVNSSQFGFSTVAPFYSWMRREFQFGVGAGAGVLSELGATGAFGTPAYTRALIKDAGGNPTTVTVLSDEILIVTYERRTYATTSDVTSLVSIKGVPTTVTIRPSQLGLPSGMSGQGTLYWSDYGYGGFWYTGGSGLGVGASTGKPSGTEEYPTTDKADLPYVAGTYYRDQTMNLSTQELAGTLITGFKGVGSAINYQIGFMPGVAKTSAEAVALRLRMSWVRYTP